MTDKEFKRLGRAQLMDIIYQLQLEVDTLTEKNQQLKKDLADKRFRIENAGNIAEAALEINNCFRSAQNAAEQYLNEIKAIHGETEAERTRILTEARQEAEAILSQAKAEAETILDDAKKNVNEYDSAVAAILEEYKQDQSDNG